MTVHALLKNIKILITLLASAYVFILIPSAAWYITAYNVSHEGIFQEAKDLFLAGLPIASGVIGYWFADSQRKETVENNGDPNRGGNQPKINDHEN